MVSTNIKNDFQACVSISHKCFDALSMLHLILQHPVWEIKQ